ncbi:MAG: hypothetical protein U9P38_03105 [Campylobacterota bacterium]|nr:hypothetical protein [Campylobacterota bacterium]
MKKFKIMNNQELLDLKQDLKKSINFSTIKLEDLEFDNSFDDWFCSDIKLNQDTKDFLEKLLNREKNLLKTYNEEDLKVNFLVPIFNKIDFRDDNRHFRAFYEHKISFENGNISLNGTADFIVGRGFKYLEKPIFFIQEFKKGLEYSNPEPQLLAEMIAGLEISDLSKIRGAYIVGTLWNFVVLEKIENRYYYSISDEFNAKRLNELESIYKNLVFVKNEIIEIIG